MGVDDRSGDREAEPGPLSLRREERIEEVLFRRCGHAGAVVGDHEEGVPGVIGDRDPNPPRVGGCFDCVRQQIEDYLPQLRLVTRGEDGCLLRLDDDAPVPELSGGSKAL